MGEVRGRLRPGPALFTAALAALGCAAFVFFLPEAAVAWYAALVILPCAAADALALVFFAGRPRVERRVAASHTLGIPSTVELIVSCPRPLSRSLTLFDLYDGLFDCGAFPARMRLPAPDADETSRAVFSYQITPVERGEWFFPACEFLLSSPLRFWRLMIRVEEASRGRVYPDFRLLARAGGLRAALVLAGEKNTRKRGEGLEFDHLREWTPGDNVRSVDWRATGRRGKAIVRQYVEEQDQQVFFILDSGYRLHRRHEFDDALGAAMLLSWTALKHGDAAGGSVFGGSERWIPPRRGMTALSRVMNALYDVKSAPSPSSVSTALETALSRLKRRSFIALISNFREEDEEQLEGVFRQTGSRHLLLIVNIREPETETLAARSGGHGEGALVAAAARAYIEGRRRLLLRWQARGLLTLECPARALSAELINRYLAVKRSGRL